MEVAGEHRRAAGPGYHPLMAVAAAAAGGAVADRLGGGAWPLELAGSIACLAVWARLRRASLLLVAVALATALGHHATAKLACRDALDLRLRPAPTPLVLRAVALQAPALTKHAGRRDDPLWVAAVEVSAMRDGTRWSPTRGRGELAFSLPSGAKPHFGAGDRLKLYCEGRRHPPPANPGDWDPAQSSRTRRQCLLRASHAADVVVLRKASVWSPRRLLAAARRGVESRLRRHIAPRQADLAVALLLGRRELMEREDRMAFVNSGTAHLLALSGLHVGLLVGWMWAAGRLGWLTRRQTCAAAAATALAYLVLAGPRPSLVRAAVLIAGVACARWMARPRAAWNTLALAALLLLAWDPTQLFDTGAQLSFLAVAALCRWGSSPRGAPPADPLRRLIWESRGPVRRLAGAAGRLLGQWLLISAVVWVVTAPVVAWRFGRLAPIGICLNPLLGPLVAAALYAEVAVVILGSALAPAGQIFGWLGSSLLAWTLALAQWGAQLPGGHWELARPPAAWAAAGCGLWLGWAVTASRRWPLAVATTAWLAWGAAAQGRPLAGELHCTVLSVGHGACVVIRTPSGATAIYDAGRLGGGGRAARAALQCLDLERVRRVERLIISHEDADHYNAVPLLLERIVVEQLRVGPRMLRRSTPEPGAAWLASEIRRSGVPVRHWSEGDDASWGGGVRVEVLHPPRHWQGGAADNADSLVLRIACRGRSILLTGDVEGPGLQRLMARHDLQADVLLAPHHGSPRSFPVQLANRCGARWLIVSAGDSTPAPVWAEGAVLHTARDGAVRVTIGRAGLTVRSWRGSPW